MATRPSRHRIPFVACLARTRPARHEVDRKAGRAGRREAGRQVRGHRAHHMPCSGRRER